MSKGRLEAFTDGVLAIIITIMVLELRPPHGESFADLVPLVPVFLSYLLSFVFLGIYWSNHHHLWQAVESVKGGVLWANLHLLFWLSLVPFTTAWMGENHFAAGPVALYGVVLIAAAGAYTIMVRVLLACHGKRSKLAAAIGEDRKGKVSIGLYALALLVSPWAPGISLALYVAVALIWLVPDRRIEKVLFDR